MPIAHGKAISKVVRRENVILLLAVFISPFAIAAETAGTSAVAKAIFSAAGIPISISTLPAKIPYSLVASSLKIQSKTFLIH